MYQDSAFMLSWFWRRSFLSIFTIYGHGGHLNSRTMTIWTNFQSPINRRLQVKFEENWPRGFWGDVVQRCLRTDWRTMEDGGKWSQQLILCLWLTGELKNNMYFLFPNLISTIICLNTKEYQENIMWHQRNYLYGDELLKSAFSFLSDPIEMSSLVKCLCQFWKKVLF